MTNGLDREKEFWSDAVSLEPRASIVLRGGGIRGLFFPGHMIGLMKRGFQRANAYAGASAGAMIATALWSGWHPQNLTEKIKGDSGCTGLLFRIFSPKDLFIVIFGFVKLWMAANINAILIIINLFLQFIAWIFSKCYNPIAEKMSWHPYLDERRRRLWIGLWRPVLGCDGERFERYINSFVIGGLLNRSIDVRYIEEYAGVPINSFRPTFLDFYKIIKYVRRINAVESLDDEAYLAFKESFPQIEKRESEIVLNDKDDFGTVRNNILSLTFGGRGTWDAYLPPIFLSVADIGNGVAVLANNLEDKYLTTPICTLVRASAGHPAAFRPVQLTFSDQTSYFTDGGVILNYPAGAVGYHLRRCLRSIFNGESKVLDRFEYEALRMSPHVIIGLSTEDAVDVKRQAGKRGIYGVMFGKNRDYLETEISRRIAYFSPLVQPLTGEPNFLNFGAVKRSYIQKIYESAEKFVEDHPDMQASIPFENEDRDEVLRTLRRILTIVARRYIDDGEYCRVHLFLEGGRMNTALRKKAVVISGASVDGFNDIESSIEKENAGLVGLCRYRSMPIFANVDLLRNLRKNSDKPVLGLSYDDMKHMPPDMNFCFAFPVYDLSGLDYEPPLFKEGKSSQGILPVESYNDCVAGFEGGLTGLTTAVISIDGRSKSLGGDFEKVCQTLTEDMTFELVERESFALSALARKRIKDMVKPYRGGASQRSQ